MKFFSREFLKSIKNEITFKDILKLLFVIITTLIGFHIIAFFFMWLIWDYGENIIIRTIYLVLAFVGMGSFLYFYGYKIGMVKILDCGSGKKLKLRGNKMFDIFLKIPKKEKAVFILSLFLAVAFFAFMEYMTFALDTYSQWFQVAIAIYVVMICFGVCKHLKYLKNKYGK
jgi:hypothetical protein